MSDNATDVGDGEKEDSNEMEQEEDQEEEEENEANQTEEDHSLTMPTDDGDDAFETIQLAVAQVKTGPRVSGRTFFPSSNHK